MFFIRNDALSSDKIEVLDKDKEITLSLNDKIGFLRNDFWFRIERQADSLPNSNVLEQNEVNVNNEEDVTFQIDPSDFNEEATNSNASNTSNSMFRVRNVGEINETGQKRKMPSWLFSEVDKGEESSSSKKSKNEDTTNNYSIANESTSVVESTSNENKLNSNSSIVVKDEPASFDVIGDCNSANDTNEIESKTKVNENVNAEDNNVSRNSDATDNESENESENNSNVNITAGPSAPVIPARKVKKEKADSSSAPLRPSCQFGIKCYR